MSNGSVITTAGTNNLLDFWSGGIQTRPSRIRVGTGTGTPAVSDTALGTDLGAVGYINYSASFVDTTNKKIVNTATLGASQGNGNTISELGEFNSDGTPIMTSHDVITGIVKTSAKLISFTITHQGS